MATPRPLRTSMYVPGNKEDWMRKAPQYGSDALILDLEAVSYTHLRAHET